MNNIFVITSGEWGRLLFCGAGALSCGVLIGAVVFFVQGEAYLHLVGILSSAEQNTTNSIAVLSRMHGAIGQIVAIFSDSRRIKKPVLTSDLIGIALFFVGCWLVYYCDRTFNGNWSARWILFWASGFLCFTYGLFLFLRGW